MDRYAAGEDEAFALVYDAIAPRILSFLLRRTSIQQDAEDLQRCCTFIADAVILSLAPRCCPGRSPLHVDCWLTVRDSAEADTEPMTIGWTSKRPANRVPMISCMLAS
jgi:hypothetical protein